MRVCVRVCVCVCACTCTCTCVYVWCPSAPETLNYIHVILNLYNQFNKFVAFRSVTKLSMPAMHGRGLCNEVHRDSNKAIIISAIKNP